MEMSITIPVKSGNFSINSFRKFLAGSASIYYNSQWSKTGIHFSDNCFPKIHTERSASAKKII